LSTLMLSQFTISLSLIAKLPLSLLVIIITLLNFFNWFIESNRFFLPVNSFISSEHEKIKGLKIDEQIQKTQTDKLRLLKSNRDNERANSILEKLAAVAKNSENLMPTVIEAVENYCTLGEIADVLRKEFGEYK
jgi:methylmalonyl-CoA mutase N-terminal domain/subunit